MGDAVPVDGTWEDVNMICPNQCVCLHAPFMDLSIARWIREVQHEAIQEKTPINENEVSKSRRSCRSHD